MSNFAVGTMVDTEIEGKPYVVCRTADGVYAMDGTCPHRQGPLAQGALHGTQVVCPWHAWEFDCVTGRHDYNPAIRLETFAVRVEGDDVVIEIP